jgi:hypothetical protein
LAVKLPLEKNYERYESETLCTEEKYDEVFEKFLDDIFDFDAFLSKEKFL